MWNGKFFNFYNGGYEILVHKKWWNSDRQDQSSFAFVADGLNSAEYPEVLTFNGRQVMHQCFDRSMHGGQRSSGGPNAFQREVLQETVGDTRLQRTGGLNMTQILEEALESNIRKVSLNHSWLRDGKSSENRDPERLCKNLGN